ncbi:Glycosyl transferase family 2 [Nonlabens sp. Hel1_33_55]|uniref:glycosyltransferase n=1 Tax=Nonlabens sp. Hel1_33_55 TaxID=1336802 RepID=UPI000875C2B4|nr:glycosyltransferase family A protein [Nonlabens sp. Hel1_33_55]SCY15983.1 Glycosyl transferase family 2 [Nonlabens sp. Hel1_33_55]
MRIAIIIPAYNEATFISLTLDSLLAQSLQASQIVVVDDNSTDGTFEVAKSFKDWLPITVIRNKSSAENIPGTKVINAFKKGLELIDLDRVDVICKFDADLIFPSNYLEVVSMRFHATTTRGINSSENSTISDIKTGMVAGHCTIEVNSKWVIENQNNPDHIRGALKAYQIDCFKEIGGLKSSIGWDTMDEMLARYYGWKVVTIDGLHVKHLKPTGAAYKSKSMQLQGEAFFKMRYGWPLTLITAAKMAMNKKHISLFFDYVAGYLTAEKSGLEPLLNKDQGRFLRSYRWNGIKSKIGF